MEPLDGLDSAFVSLETSDAHLHIVAALLLEPPEGRRSLFSPTTRYLQIRRTIERRLPLLPAFRQRLQPAPLGLVHPGWVDEPEFDLDDHLHRICLPAPGDRRLLDTQLAEIAGRPLDMDRPLWEMTVVEGVQGGRCALVVKLHHAILDGVSGAQLLAAFLDPGPRERVVDFPDRLWQPAPLPSLGDQLRFSLEGLRRQPRRIFETVARAVVAGLDVAAQGQERAQQSGDPTGSPPPPFAAPRTSLNGTVSRRRSYSSLSVPLDDVRAVSRAFGTTVNEVLLACVGSALAEVIAARDEVVPDALVAMVPVSTRRPTEAARPGNKVSGMLVRLPVCPGSESNQPGNDAARANSRAGGAPVDHLLAVAGASRAAKERAGAVGDRVMADLAEVVIPAVASRLARTARGTRLFDHVAPIANVTVSSVIGPDVPLWCAGGQVVELLPAGPVADGVGLNVTVFTYRDVMTFGVLACRRLVPEVDELASGISEVLDELVVAAADPRGRSVG